MKRPAIFYCVLGLSALAITLQLTGFILPAWIHMKRDVPKVVGEMLFISAGTFSNKGMTKEDGVKRDGDMVFPPQAEEMPEDDEWVSDSSSEEKNVDREDGSDGRRRPPHHGGHHGHHHRRPPHHGGHGPGMSDGDSSSSDETGGQMMQQNLGIPTAKEMLLIDPTTSISVSVSYGLWFSKFCQHDVPMRHKREAEGHRKKKCKSKCKIVCTEDALKMAPLFEDMDDLMEHKGRMLSKDNMGHASLREHRVETTLALVFCMLGLVTGILAFRNKDACRCFALACAVTMLISTVLITVPALRIGSYTVHRRHHAMEAGVRIHCPTSAILAAVSGLVTGICFIIAIVAFFRKRNQRARRWLQFTNEVEKEKKQGLYMVAEPLPKKVDLSFAPAIYEYEVMPEPTPEPEAAPEPEKKPIE